MDRTLALVIKARTKFLLVREAQGQSFGSWVFPSARLGENDNAYEAARRLARNQLGLSVHPFMLAENLGLAGVSLVLCSLLDDDPAVQVGLRQKYVGYTWTYILVAAELTLAPLHRRILDFLLRDPRIFPNKSRGPGSASIPDPATRRAIARRAAMTSERRPDRRAGGHFEVPHKTHSFRFTSFDPDEEQRKAQRIKNRGFASMPKPKRQQIARLGGKAVHAQGTGHRYTSEEGRRAGRIGARNKMLKYKGVVVEFDEKRIVTLHQAYKERKITIAQICEKLQIARPTLYRYFAKYVKTSSRTDL